MLYVNHLSHLVNVSFLLPLHYGEGWGEVGTSDAEGFFIFNSNSNKITPSSPDITFIERTDCNCKSQQRYSEQRFEKYLLNKDTYLLFINK